MCVTRATHVARAATVRTVLAVAAVVKTKARTRAARKNLLPLAVAIVRPVNTSRAKAPRLANNSVRRHALPPLIVLRTSSWTMTWITSATALTTCLRPNRPRVVAVVRVLRHKARPLLAPAQVLHAPAASHKVAKAVRAAATAQPPARRRPSAVAHATALHVTVR